MSEKYVNRKVVTSQIDATLDSDRVVAVRFVKSDGSIRDMRVQKSPRKASDKSKTSVPRSTHYVQRKGLIGVIDQDTMQRRDLFIFSLIGFDPTGQGLQFHRISHSHQS